MRYFLLNLFVMSLLSSCSVYRPKKVANRGIARHVEMVEDFSIVEDKVDELLNQVTYSYMLGQVSLEEFDEQLKSDPENAMSGQTYSDLLSIRILVDSFEDQVKDQYLGLVLASALPEYSIEEKIIAEKTLINIEQFMDGVRNNKEDLPENLRPMVLSNLQEKQVVIHDELKVFSEDPSIVEKNSKTQKIIQQYMKKLKTKSQRKYKGMEAYQVDKEVLGQSLEKDKKSKVFLQLKSKIKNLSEKMKSLILVSKKGRSTSSDAITPSAGPSGNITGRNFPANTWTLTYDDGPASKTSLELLRDLQANDFPATFFMLAKQVEGLPHVAKMISESPGMDIASHSYDHAQLTKVGPAELERQIGTSKTVIEKKLGKKIKLFRLPYGAGVSSTAIRTKIAEHDMIHVFWNVDTLDWQDKNPQTIYERALRQMKASPKNAGIILFHDIHPQAVAASAKLMKYLKETKANVCTVQGIVDQMNEGLSGCK